MKMTLSIRYMINQFQRLQALGFSQDAAMKVAGLKPQDCYDLSSRVELIKMVSVFKAAQDVTNNTNIGLSAGFNFNVASFAKTGRIYSFCRNIPQVIRMNAKYQQLAIDAGEIAYKLSLDTDTAQIRHFMSFRPYMEDVETYRHIIDSIAGSYCRTYRWLTRTSEQDILHVDFPYEAPKDLSLHKLIFRCPMRFNQAELRLEFSQSTMGHEIATYNPGHLARAEMRLAEVLYSSNFSNRLQVKVKTAIKSSLDQGVIGTHIIAQHMNKPWSSLRRELIDADLSYRDLLENVRQEMFHECLEQGQSFAQIAHSLAYNDQAAFAKAFKRWYGVSPRQWKAAYDITKTSQPNYNRAAL